MMVLVPVWALWHVVKEYTNFIEGRLREMKSGKSKNKQAKIIIKHELKENNINIFL